MTVEIYKEVSPKDDRDTWRYRVFFIIKKSADMLANHKRSAILNISALSYDYLDHISIFYRLFYKL